MVGEIRFFAVSISLSPKLGPFIAFTIFCAKPDGEDDGGDAEGAGEAEGAGDAGDAGGTDVGVTVFIDGEGFSDIMLLLLLFLLLIYILLLYNLIALI
jgi:hypothetical protein